MEKKVVSAAKVLVSVARTIHERSEWTKKEARIMSEENERYKFTANQKMALYIVTLLVAAAVYLVPQIPGQVWKWALLGIAIFIGGGLLVGMFAIWQVFRTGRRAIQAHVNFGGCGQPGKRGRVTIGKWSAEEEEQEAGAS